LWGWDKENFTEGQDNGVIEIDNLLIVFRVTIFVENNK
jgi:hypothetical protein